MPDYLTRFFSVILIAFVEWTFWRFPSYELIDRNWT